MSRAWREAPGHVQPFRRCPAHRLRVMSRVPRSPVLRCFLIGLHGSVTISLHGKPDCHDSLCQGASGIPMRRDVESEESEERAPEVDRRHYRVQHRMILECGDEVVRANEQLQHDQGDGNGTTGAGILRPERPSNDDVHRQIPEGDLALPSGSNPQADAPPSRADKPS